MGSRVEDGTEVDTHKSSKVFGSFFWTGSNFFGHASHEIVELLNHRSEQGRRTHSIVVHRRQAPNDPHLEESLLDWSLLRGGEESSSMSEEFSRKSFGKGLRIQLYLTIQVEKVKSTRCSVGLDETTVG